MPGPLGSPADRRLLLARCLCPTDQRGNYTDVTGAGLKLLDEAARNPELVPLVRAVE